MYLATVVGNVQMGSVFRVWQARRFHDRITPLILAAQTQAPPIESVPAGPSMTLSRARCTNHENRQASGICPACGRAFCRECLTEHGGRLTCAGCLRRAESPARPGSTFREWKKQLTVPAMLVGALLASWLFFYTLGSSLEMMTAPDSPPAATRSSPQ